MSIENPNSLQVMQQEGVRTDQTQDITNIVRLLKKDAYACFVVGEVRDKNGFYIGFVPDTIKSFEKCGMKFYNEAVLLQSGLGAAGMRANGNMKSQKLVKVHQNILVFKKA